MNIESQMQSAARHLKKQMFEIPPFVLEMARGLVFLTMIKGAFIWSGSLSTGIVVKRLSSDKWSPPVSLGMASFGFGLQAGGEKADIIIVLGDDDEIDTFAGTGQLKLGVSGGLAAGPIGRDVDISAYVGKRGLACSMYYAYTKGVFAGFSLEGAVLVSRWSANKSFYGDKVKVKDVLNGKVDVPITKQTQVEAFHQTLIDFEKGRLEGRIYVGTGEPAATQKKQSAGTIQKKQSTASSGAPEISAEDEQELLLQFSELGVTGKQILRSSLEGSGVSVVFTADHIVNEDDPVYKAYGIIGALKDDTGVILEGTLESGLGSQLADYVRIRVNHGGVQREGLVSRYIKSLGKIVRDSQHLP